MAGNRKITIEFLGDSKDLQNAIGDVDGKSSKLGATLGKVGKAAALGLGAGLVIGGAALVKMTQGAIEDEAAQAKLAKTLENTAGATKTQVAAVEDWISAQGVALGVTDDELRPALEKLVTATGDVGEAQKLASLAMDVSAGSGKSLDAVSTALMKAQNGQISGLSKLGVETKNAAGETLTFEQVTKKMGDTFEGQAATKAATLEGKMAKLKLILGEAGEEIGSKLIPIVTQMADWFLNKGLPAIQAFGGWLQDHLPPIFEKIQAVVKKVMDAMNGDVGGGLAGVKAIFDDAVSIITSVWNTFGSTIVDFVVKMFDNLKQIIGGAFDIIQGIFKTFSSLLKGDWQGVWDGIKQILSGAWEVIKGVVKQALNVLGTVFELGWTALKNIVGAAWDGIKTLIVLGITKWVELLTAIPGKFVNALSSLAGTVGGLFRDAMDAGKEKVIGIGATIVDWISGIPGKLLNLAGQFGSAGRALLQQFIDGMKNAAGVIEGIASNVWNTVRGLLNSAIGKINAALSFTIDLPLGKSITIDPPDIPALAKGGLVTRPTLALIGEDGPEAVVPLSRKHNPGGNMPGMGGGDVYNFYITTLDPAGAGKYVESVLVKHQRSTGRPLAFATT